MVTSQTDKENVTVYFVTLLFRYFSLSGTSDEGVTSECLIILSRHLYAKLSFPSSSDRCITAIIKNLQLREAVLAEMEVPLTFDRMVVGSNAGFVPIVFSIRKCMCELHVLVRNK